MKLFKKKEPKSYEISEKQLACTHCSGVYFWTKRVQLNTSWATFIGWDWANKSALTFTCSDCGCIQWFHD